MRVFYPDEINMPISLRHSFLIITINKLGDEKDKIPYPI